MNSKGQRGNCIHNWQWERIIHSTKQACRQVFFFILLQEGVMPTSSLGCLTVFVEGDRKKALCNYFDWIIDVPNKGETKKTTVEALAANDINII